MDRNLRTIIVIVVATLTSGLATYGVYRAVQGMPVRQVEVPVPANAPVLIACLPYEVKQVQGKVSTEGGQMRFQCSLITEPTGSVGTHVFHMEFHDPKGNPSWNHSMNVTAPRGYATGTLNFLPGDMVGNWKMTLTDVLSGKHAEITVEVK